MNLVSKKVIKEILKKYQIKPSKKFGQNFLIDQSVIRKVIRATDLKPTDTILEIGPGIGTLTQEIAKKSGKVIAVEKDPRMIEILKENLKDFKNIELINTDILSYKLLTPTPKFGVGTEVVSYKIIANLPFCLTAPVIKKFLENVEIKPQQMVLIIQKEVAQRICSQSKMNLLAVFVQFYAQVKIIDYISKDSFWPEPKVNSAIIKITPQPQKLTTRPGLVDLFFKIVKAGFSHPRKQILNNFEKELKLNKPPLPKNRCKGRAKIKQWLVQNNIQPSQRAETLSTQDWLNLTKTFKKD